MTTSNRIVINEIPNVLFVPQEAVFEKVDKKLVYIKNGSGFDERIVEIGEKSENYVVIKKGLNIGDEVALRDPTINIEKTSGSEGSSQSVEMPS
jgi:multidrug efflux pump subunit AcrA (membrane-fusion protein)